VPATRSAAEKTEINALRRRLEELERGGKKSAAKKPTKKKLTKKKMGRRKE
jgi:hypothetical protein